MQQIELNDKIYQLPETWAEIAEGKQTSSQLPQLIDLLFMRPDNGETYHELLRMMLGFSKKSWARMMKRFFGKNIEEEEKQQSAEALQQLLGVIDWMWKKPLLKQPFVSLKFKGTEYFLPEENFYTMSWGELKDAYVHCEAFGRQLVPGETHLDLLVATLCRPKREDNYLKNEKWNGDIRETYNEFIAKERAKQLKNLSFAHKLSVLLFFAGTAKDMMNSYDIYPEGDGETVEQYLGQGFEENTLVLAEKGIFGNYASTSSTNCHNILIALERNKKLIEAETEAYKNDSN